MKKVLALLLVCSMMLTALVGCGSKKEETKAADGTKAAAEQEESKDEAAPTYGKTKIAAPIPLTGANSQYGIAYRNALEMAVKEFNESGGLNGTDVVLEVLDDQSDVTQATNLANQIIDDPDVFAVVGTFGSSVGMAVAPTYQAGGMPLIAPNISHQDFPALGEIGRASCRERV